MVSMSTIVLNVARQGTGRQFYSILPKNTQSQKVWNESAVSPACDQLFLNRPKLRRHYCDAHKKWLNNRTCKHCFKLFDRKDKKGHMRIQGILMENFVTDTKAQAPATLFSPGYIHVPYLCEIFTRQLRSHFLKHMHHSMSSPGYTHVPYLWEIFLRQLETGESFHDREDCLLNALSVMQKSSSRSS